MSYKAYMSHKSPQTLFWVAVTGVADCTVAFSLSFKKTNLSKKSETHYFFVFPERCMCSTHSHTLTTLKVPAVRGEDLP